MWLAPGARSKKKKSQKVGTFVFTIDHFVGLFLKINGDSMVAI
jgi:hypothetical protein